jgi:hypothetical protein
MNKKNYILKIIYFMPYIMNQINDGYCKVGHIDGRKQT